MDSTADDSDESSGEAGSSVWASPSYSGLADIRSPNVGGAFALRGVERRKQLSGNGLHVYRNGQQQPGSQIRVIGG